MPKKRTFLRDPGMFLRVVSAHGAPERKDATDLVDARIGVSAVRMEPNVGDAEGIERPFQYGRMFVWCVLNEEDGFPGPPHELQHSIAIV